eukprot:CAMPEP_0171219896 /NCGR_PEP_ID=MMETSP0790-20130122/33954_1 /TAXON_ID=2925 /ORGANISM="Alexandrium catenella, Strain OF101" /LENGTH=136 /DNA_ID=CAMNT_0011685765 /DNA_START=68 /DNA_END=478 /DNA_ORIENTATION=+
MPEITASLSRCEARRRREDAALAQRGAAGWRMGGAMVYGADGNIVGDDARSRSPARNKETVERLARNFVPQAKEGEEAAGTEQKSAIQKAREMKEKEREKARLKKLAREEEEKQRALQKEANQKERQSKPDKVKRY